MTMLKSSDEGCCLRTMTDDDIWRLGRNYCQEARTALLIAMCKTTVSTLQVVLSGPRSLGGCISTPVSPICEQHARCICARCNLTVNCQSKYFEHVYGITVGRSATSPTYSFICMKACTIIARLVIGSGADHRHTILPNPLR